MTGEPRARGAPAWLGALVLAVASAAAWFLPEPKPGAVAGHLDHWQWVRAVGLTALCLSWLGVALVPGSRRRPVGLRVASAWIGFALTLGLWEAAAWLIPPPDSVDNPWYLATGRGLVTSDDLAFSRPPHLHWEGLSRGDLAMLGGDTDPAERHVVFQTDFEGFRNSTDRAEAKLVFIGDSFTEAGNVPEDETFVRVAERELSTTARNLGRAGYTAPSELLVLESVGLRSRPETVVWQVAESNDLDEAVLFEQWRESGRPYPIDPRARENRLESWRRRSPTRRIFDRLREREPWPLGGTFRDAAGTAHAIRFLPVAPGAAQRPAAHAGWPILERSLRRGAALLSERGIRLAVLLIPMKLRAMGPYVDFDPASRRRLPVLWDIPEDKTLAAALAALCRELGVEFLDATATLREGAAAGELVYLPYDTHLSARGHERVAELVSARLSRAR